MKNRRPSRHLRSLVALAASAAASNLVLAQPASTSAPEQAEGTGKAGVPASTLPAVVITGKTERPLDLDAASQTGSRLGLSLRETPASVETITRDTIEQRGARTLEEALRGAVGVSVGGNPGSPGIASTRGFTGGFITYLFDGGRVSTPTMSNRPQDSFNYERIEVIKGPASVLYGEGGIGGAVNFVPKQPDRRSAGAEALLSYGSYGTLRAGVGLGNVLGETGAYRLDFSHNQSKGWVERTDSKSDHLTAAVNFALAPTVKLDLSADYLRDDIGAYFGTPLVPASFAAEPTDVVSDSNGRVIDKRLARTNYNVADGVMKSDSLWLRAKLAWQIAPQWRLRNEFGFYTADRRWRNAESLSFVAPDRMNRDQVDISHDHKVWGDRLDLSHEGELAGMKNRFLVGLEYNKTDFASARRFSNGFLPTLQVAAVNPVVGLFNDDPLLGDGSGNRTNVTADVTTTALFAEDALKLTDALTLVAGLRTEHIKLDRTIDDIDRIAPSFTAFSTSYRPTSARLGVVYDWSRATALYAQVVNATAAVGSSNLLLQSSTNSRFPLTRGKQFEIGLKQSLADNRFDWTLALYKIEQDNVLSRSDLSASASPVNNGKMSSEGVELAGAWRATRELTLSGNVSLLNAQFDTLIESGQSRVGNTPPNVPLKTGNLWADYRFAGLPLSVGAALRGVSGAYTNSANTVRMKGYWLGDVYASWATKPAVFTLRVRNVTDELYATWAGASANNQVVLGAPRTVELSARFDF